MFSAYVIESKHFGRNQGGDSVHAVVADGLEPFELHVASLQRPLVVLFQQQRNGKADDRGVVFREMPSDRSRTRFTIAPYRTSAVHFTKA